MSTFFKTGKKIVAIGRNYAAHIKELNHERPTEPFYFLKPTTSYLASGGNVEIPRGGTVHHEVELGIVFGKKGRDISPKDAFDYIAGYTVAIDYTVRNWQRQVISKGLPWSSVKGFDTFTPVSEFIPKDKVADPQNLLLELIINGETRQKGKTDLMIFRIPELIAHVSSISTIEPGDLMLTGTPEGVGPILPGDKVFARLSQGDEVLATLEHGVVERLGGYQVKL